MVARQPTRSEQAGMGVNDSTTLLVFKEWHMLAYSRASYIAGPVCTPDYLCRMLVGGYCQASNGDASRILPA